MRSPEPAGGIFASLGWELCGLGRRWCWRGASGQPYLTKQDNVEGEPNRSLSEILSASAWQSFLAVVAEPVSSILVVPSMNVTGSIIGFLDLVAWEMTQEGLWESLHFRPAHILTSLGLGSRAAGNSELLAP